MTKTNNLSAYLNAHNGGVFRELTDEEIAHYSAVLNTNDYEFYVPYSIREETNDVISIYDRAGTTSNRLFSRIPKSKLFPNNEKHYLHDIMTHYFDVQDLNTDKWTEDDNGFYTTDLQEIAWFKMLEEAYSNIPEKELRDNFFGEYNDIIDYYNGKKEGK